jgi:ribosomal protein S18 acetylase RimI-like enzyme
MALPPGRFSGLPMARQADEIQIEYRRADGLDPAVYIDILTRSGLAERRPVGDRDRIARMLTGANLIIAAYHENRVVGVARSLTDYAYCCYLSDLAVDRDYQGRGIGQRLIEETRRAAGPETMCLLVAAPDSTSFYERIGMPRQSRAFMYSRER